MSVKLWDPVYLGQTSTSSETFRKNDGHIFPSKIKRDLTNGPKKSKVLELLDTQV